MLTVVKAALRTDQISRNVPTYQANDFVILFEISHDESKQYNDLDAGLEGKM